MAFVQGLETKKNEYKKLPQNHSFSVGSACDFGRSRIREARQLLNLWCAGAGWMSEPAQGTEARAATKSRLG